METIEKSGLTQEQCQQFERDGYLVPLNVLRPDEVDRYLAHYAEYTSQQRDRLAALTPNLKYQVLSETHFVLPWVYEIVSHPRILDVMSSLLGPNLLAWNTTWFTKMPGEATYVGWHQDGTYWNLEPPNVVTAWVALSPSQPENGCMRVVPGTHTQPMMPQRETYIPDNMLSRGQEMAAEVNEEDAVDMALKPGQMSLHHIWIVHGSNANTSPDTPRIGLAIRYTRPEVVQDSPHKPMAMLVRGVDEYGNFETRPVPESDDTAQQMRDHKAIVDRLRAGIMKDTDKA